MSIRLGGRRAGCAAVGVSDAADRADGRFFGGADEAAFDVELVDEAAVVDPFGALISKRPDLGAFGYRGDFVAGLFAE
jgi:hypothetical protein